MQMNMLTCKSAQSDVKAEGWDNQKKMKANKPEFGNFMSSYSETGNLYIFGMMGKYGNNYNSFQNYQISANFSDLGSVVPIYRRHQIPFLFQRKRFICMGTLNHVISTHHQC